MVFTFKNAGGKVSVGASLEYSIRRAAQDGRLTKGVYDCAKALENDSSKAMVCLLAEDYFQDVTSHIHFVLLGAFCLEQNVPLIKVDRASKVSEILTTDDEEVDNMDNFSCVLIELPEGNKLSSTEEDVLSFSERWKDSQSPVVELP